MTARGLRRRIAPWTCLASATALALNEAWPEPVLGQWMRTGLGLVLASATAAWVVQALPWDTERGRPRGRDRE